MKHIFEGNWIYLAHESQIPNANDYFTTYIGRQPVVITRDKDGELHASSTPAPPRRDAVPPQDRQQARRYTCPFHGWTFSNNGKLLKVKDPRRAPATRSSFNTDGSTT